MNYTYYDRQGEITWEYMEIHKFLIFFGGYEAPKCQARLVETLSYPSVGPQAVNKCEQYAASYGGGRFITTSHDIAYTLG